MKISASIDLVMQFASYEAIAGQFREVETEHLLMAILKLAELQAEEVEKLISGVVAIKQGTGEIQAIRKQLTNRAVDSTKVRRELRSMMGKGNSPFSGGRIHRSIASRKIFDEAGRLADDAGNEIMTAEHIFEALMVTPTALMERVLGHAIGVKGDKLKNTPLLDEYGKDITQLAKESRLQFTTGRKAECNALVEALKQSDRKSVLLISNNDDVVSSVVLATARAIVSQDSTSDLKNKHIVDVTKAKPLEKWSKQTSDRLEKIFTEASFLENIVLFLPAYETTNKVKLVNDWLGFLKKACAKNLVVFICRMDPGIYQEYMHKDAIWKRIARVIWIRDNIKGEIPREL